MKKSLLPLCLLFSAFHFANGQTPPNATSINATDVVGGALPLQITDNANNYVFGSTTFGRQIRLTRGNNQYFFDIGLDVNNHFFLTGPNTTTAAR